MKNYNRKERRKLARMLGLRGNKESYKVWFERTFRSIQAGNQISQQVQSQNENETRQQLVDIAARATRHLAEGVPMRYSKRELIKKATYKLDGTLDTPAEYKEPEPIVFSQGHGEAEARRIMESNYRIMEDRSARLRQRHAKQKSNA